jgi:hypothetical protein
MAKKQARKGTSPRVSKTVLRLPDLDLAKSAVFVADNSHETGLGFPTFDFCSI